MKRTVTPKMLIANRQNAQKSTGPKTPQGKHRSSQNAIRHGLLAKPVFIENDLNEDPADFESLLTALYDDHKPQGDHELLLVQRIAVSYWRLRRAYRFETQSIENNRNENSDAILPAPQELDLLIRYEGLIDRELHRVTTHLERLQAQRHLHEQQEQEMKDGQTEEMSPRMFQDPMPPIRNSQSAIRNSQSPPPPALRPDPKIGNRKLEIKNPPVSQASGKKNLTKRTRASLPAPQFLNPQWKPHPHPLSFTTRLVS